MPLERRFLLWKVKPYKNQLLFFVVIRETKIVEPQNSILNPGRILSNVIYSLMIQNRTKKCFKNRDRFYTEHVRMQKNCVREIQEMVGLLWSKHKHYAPCTITGVLICIKCFVSSFLCFAGRKFTENCQFCFKDGTCKRQKFMNQFCHVSLKDIHGDNPYLLKDLSP